MKKFCLTLILSILTIGLFAQQGESIELPTSRSQVIWESTTFDYGGKKEFNATWRIGDYIIDATIRIIGEFEGLTQKEIYIFDGPLKVDDPDYIKILNLRDNFKGTWWVKSKNVTNTKSNPNEMLLYPGGRGLGT